MADIKATVERIREISLEHQEVKSFYVGNTWDMAASKSSDIYPNVWVEFPVLIDYTLKDKTYTFSIDVLDLPKNDDTWDEMVKQSECEGIADDLLQAYKKYIANFNMGRITGLTVKNINADIATGVRIDVQFITNRTCDIESRFKTKLVRK